MEYKTYCEEQDRLDKLYNTESNMTALQKQLESIKNVMELDTCSRCSFQAVFMYRQENQGLCPHCDSGVIEEHKHSSEKHED